MHRAWMAVHGSCVRALKMRRRLQDKIANVTDAELKDDKNMRAVIRCAEFLVNAVDAVISPLLAKALIEMPMQLQSEQCSDAKPYLQMILSLIGVMDLFLRKPTQMAEALGAFDSEHHIKPTWVERALGGFGLFSAAGGGAVSSEEREGEEFLRMVRDFRHIGMAVSDMIKVHETLQRIVRPVREQMEEEGSCPVCWAEAKQCRHETDEPCAECPVRRFGCEHTMCSKCSQRSDIASCPMCGCEVLGVAVAEQIKRKCLDCWEEVQPCRHENDEPCPVRRFRCGHVMCRGCVRRPLPSCPVCDAPCIRRCLV
eukprot:TRINITY_DN2180_c0_g2_i3.p1 TRINITY_DN2180_c0_g2~~TRINITY_DN2180_c0_g2_i3.p1  ORF type:complete len:312 (+),score=46.32 TRINITY_DN2180_c0_g2_i3:100-1035(+)